jgi:uncharacterized protein (DUF885 family)
MQYARISLLLVVLTLLPAPVFAQDGPDADNAIIQAMDQALTLSAEANPTGATLRGDHRFDDALPDVTVEAVQRRYTQTRELLNLVTQIDRDALTEANQLNRDLLVYELAVSMRMARTRGYLTPVNQLGGPHTDLPLFAQRYTARTDAERQNYVQRLRALPAYFDQTIENMRTGLSEGRTPPMVVMQGVEAQALVHTGQKFLDNPRQHVMFSPLADMAPGDPLALEAESVIREQVLPAFAEFGAFLRDEYIPGCRETIGWSAVEGGLRDYSLLLWAHTTLPLSPDAIHQIGLEEVARIRAEMFDVIARSDFPQKDELEGDELFDAFVEYLRTDPRFYFDNPEDLIARYRDIAKQIDGELPKLFILLPRLPYGVKEMPSFIAENAPTAYYQYGSLQTGVAGTFIANTYRLDQRPKYEMFSLTMHEAMPGHHLQHALARELEELGLHEWRTTLGYNAFGEGWGLYSERLGLEMGPDPEYGFYSDPYDDFGRLSYEMWRALRLVVDTGIHAKGWSRQQAIDFMLANSALTQTNIEREVDRYIAWPGQACGYKIGELKIRELRARAEDALGPDFDVRQFHKALLEQGSLPLEILEQRMDAWIAEPIETDT